MMDTSTHRHRNQLIVFVVLLAVSAGFIVAANEDGTWQCENGAWVAVGNPEGDAPTTGCSTTEIQETVPPGEPPIANEYESKVIYGVALTAEQIALAQVDCSDRGGEYQACGNACPPDAEICLQACAHVCLLPVGEEM